MRTGAVDVTVQFLSPITPKDLVRQTLPYSYLHVSVAPNDGQSHAVKVSLRVRFLVRSMLSLKNTLCSCTPTSPASGQATIGLATLPGVNM